MCHDIEDLSIVFVLDLTVLLPTYQLLKFSIERFHAFLLDVDLRNVWNLVEVLWYKEIEITLHSLLHGFKVLLLY
jgi:hypothetical protein